VCGVILSIRHRQSLIFLPHSVQRGELLTPAGPGASELSPAANPRCFPKELPSTLLEPLHALGRFNIPANPVLKN